MDIKTLQVIEQNLHFYASDRNHEILKPKEGEWPQPGAMRCWPGGAGPGAQP